MITFLWLWKHAIDQSVPGGLFSNYYHSALVRRATALRKVRLFDWLDLRRWPIQPEVSEEFSAGAQLRLVVLSAWNAEGKR